MLKRWQKLSPSVSFYMPPSFKHCASAHVVVSCPHRQMECSMNWKVVVLVVLLIENYLSNEILEGGFQLVLVFKIEIIIEEQDFGVYFSPFLQVTKTKQ